MLTGVVLCNLTGLAPERFKGRLFAALAPAPQHARAAIIVGQLTVEPEAVRYLRQQAGRLDVEIHGDPSNVRRWIEAIRDGLPGELDDPGGGRW